MSRPEQISYPRTEELESKTKVEVKTPSISKEKEILEVIHPDEIIDPKKLEKDREIGQIHLIECGSKAMLLYYANTQFITILVNNSEKKIDGDTTKVYAKAKELMQKHATQLGKTLHYQLDTLEPKMLKWAKTKGNEMFNWEQIQKPTEHYDKWLFTTTFEPQQDTEEYVYR